MPTLCVSWLIGKILLSPSRSVKSHLSLDEISNLVEKKLECPCFPSHTQAVEQLDREVTEAGHSDAGYRHRDGFIRTRIASHRAVPNADTKSDFVAMAEA